LPYYIAAGLFCGKIDTEMKRILTARADLDLFIHERRKEILDLVLPDHPGRIHQLHGIDSGKGIVMLHSDALSACIHWTYDTLFTCPFPSIASTGIVNERT